MQSWIFWPRQKKFFPPGSEKSFFFPSEGEFTFFVVWISLSPAIDFLFFFVGVHEKVFFFSRRTTVWSVRACVVQNRLPFHKWRIWILWQRGQRKETLLCRSLFSFSPFFHIYVGLIAVMSVQRKSEPKKKNRRRKRSLGPHSPCRTLTLFHCLLFFCRCEN